jgi:hypothetical protein
MTVARELAGYKLDLVGVQVVRWDKGGTSRGDYIFVLCKRKQKLSIGNRIFVHYRIVSAVNRVEFVSDRISYSPVRSLV